MVIEDNSIIGMIIKKVLAFEGHEVDVRNNAFDGLDLMRSGTLPDLVITDLVMGSMTGRDLINTMRADSKLSRIPVIIMTGYVLNQKLLPQRDLFQDLLIKPFDIEDLITAVEKLTFKTVGPKKCNPVIAV